MYVWAQSVGVGWWGVLLALRGLFEFFGPPFQFFSGTLSQFLPHNSVPMHFLHTISMQMDREFEEEQIGTLFVPRD